MKFKELLSGVCGVSFSFIRYRNSYSIVDGRAERVIMLLGRAARDRADRCFWKVQNVRKVASSWEQTEAGHKADHYPNGLLKLRPGTKQNYPNGLLRARPQSVQHMV